MDRGGWQTTVHGVAESQTRLSDLAQHSTELSNLLIYIVLLLIIMLTF